MQPVKNTLKVFFTAINIELRVAFCPKLGIDLEPIPNGNNGYIDAYWAYFKKV